MIDKKLNTKGADVAVSIDTILSKLTVCLHQEAEAVTQNNRDAAVALQDQKIKLMEQYRALSEHLARDPSILEQLDESIHKHLKKVSAEFQEALKENARAIKAAHHSVTRLMDRIMTTARRTVMDGQQQYNAKGSLTGGVVNGTLMPTKLNQEL